MSTTTPVLRLAMLSLIVTSLGACRGGTTATPDDSTERLVARDARLEMVQHLPRDPHTDSIPGDERRAAAIRLGRQIVQDPARYAPQYTGNDLACTNCHMNGGQRDRALPWVGVAGTFPQYRAREARLISLEDRIQNCFERSINGTAPPYESPEMMAVAAYITWLAEGLPVGESPEWRGKNRIPREHQIAIAELDTERGRTLYDAQCASCHGVDGQGVDLGVARPGPLWGPRSWSDGAGAARIYTLAGYIRYAMPLTDPGSLTDEESQQIAAYINSHERPVFARKLQDFPNGDVPMDAVYYPQRFEVNPLARR